MNLHILGAPGARVSEDGAVDGNGARLSTATSEKFSIIRRVISTDSTKVCRTQSFIILSQISYFGEKQINQSISLISADPGVFLTWC